MTLQKRALYSSAVTKYNISGDTNYFRIEGMNALSEHVFAPFGEQQKGGLAVIAQQKLVYKGARTDSTLSALKSLRDESAEAKSQRGAVCESFSARVVFN